MDIDLLAKMVKDLILENDEVTLPGVGTFVAEMIPATFSDKGFTINPPYRKLSFRQREGSSDLLVDLYARSNSMDKDKAAKLLGDFLKEMKEVLKARKFIIFPELGKLRATKENLFFFVPDEDLNIYPEGYGLESVSLKSHEEIGEITDLGATVEAVAELSSHQAPPAEPAAESAGPAGPAAEPAELAATSAETAPEPEPVEPAPAKTEIRPEPASVPEPELVKIASAPAPVETAPAHAPEPASAEVAPESPAPAGEASAARHRMKLPAWLKVLITVIVAAAVLLAALAILGRVAPQFVDKFLYTQEELDILYR